MLETCEVETLHFEIMRHLPLGVMALGRDYRVTFWNETLAKWTGIGESAMVGRSILERYERLGEGRYRRLLEEVFGGGGPVRFAAEQQGGWLGGRCEARGCRVLQTTVSGITLSGEGACQALFVIEDVTALTEQVRQYRTLRDQALEEVKQRRQAEVALEESRAELERRVVQRTEELYGALVENRQVLEAIPSVLISLDERGRVVRWNGRSEVMFGLAESQVLGRSLGDCGLGWESSRVAEAMARCRSALEAVQLLDVWVRREGGSDRCLSLTFTPEVQGTQSKSPQGVLVLGVDITEYKVLESKLVQAQKLEAVGELAAGIAHEINTPVQYVQDNLTFLSECFSELGGVLERLVGMVEPEAVEASDLAYLREETPKAIEQSLEGISRVNGIVRAMKEFAHPGRRTKKPTDINEAIESTVTIARHEWKYVAEVRLLLDRELPLVRCLAGELNQAILNLLLNATDAIRERPGFSGQELGCVTITTRRAGEGVEIRVSDMGGGVPVAIQERIFDSFFTTKEPGKGTGQGLAIARSIIVNKHGGSLEFETEEGVGTTFIVWLPMEEGARLEVLGAASQN